VEADCLQLWVQLKQKQDFIDQQTEKAAEICVMQVILCGVYRFTFVCCYVRLWFSWCI